MQPEDICFTAVQFSNLFSITGKNGAEMNKVKTLSSLSVYFNSKYGQNKQYCQTTSVIVHLTKYQKERSKGLM